MIFSEVKVFQPDSFEDYRGELYTVFNQDEHRLVFNHDKVAVSRQHVLRGIHGDAKATKLITCLSGVIYLVVVDNRPESTRYLQWDSIILSEANRKQVLVPPGFGNGHLVLSDKAVFFYKWSYSGEYPDVKDVSPLLRSPLFPHAIEEMKSLVKHPDYWVGIDARGFIFASALASTNGGLIMCRKKGKLPPPTISETYSLEYGEDTLEIKPGKGKVVIVDDVYATGGTMNAVEKLCEKAGYTVIGKLVLIDLRFLHEPNDVKSLIQYE